MKLTDLQNSVIICLSQMTLLRWLTFLLGSLILNVTVLSWIFFFLLTIVFVLQWLSLHWEILICCLSFHWLSSKLKTRCFVSLYSLTIPMLIGTVFIIIWEMLHGKDIFKHSGSAAASEFCYKIQVGIDVYIPRRKYQVKSHSSPWFSAACAAIIIHRNHLFRLCQHNKSFESKVKFRWASNCCKRVLAYANKKLSGD